MVNLPHPQGPFSTSNLEGADPFDIDAPCCPNQSKITFEYCSGKSFRGDHVVDTPGAGAGACVGAGAVAVSVPVAVADAGTDADADAGAEADADADAGAEADADADADAGAEAEAGAGAGAEAGAEAGGAAVTSITSSAYTRLSLFCLFRATDAANPETVAENALDITSVVQYKK